MTKNSTFTRITTIAIGVTLSSLLLIAGCASLGTAPDDKKVENFYSSKQYNQKTKKFENRRVGIIEKDRDKAFNFSTIWEWLKGGENTVPKSKMPEDQVDIAKFMEDSGGLKFIWLGHSSLLVNFEGKIILIDPIFSSAASPVSFIAKRFQDPVIQLTDLPQVDFILISHDHYDHLDMDTVKFFKEKNVTFVAPLGVGSHLQGWGIQPDKIIEKDWMQSFSAKGIEFIATPSQHFSGRGLSEGNKTLWASWVVQSDEHKIYFSGDSGYDVHFKEIGEKLGPFDIAFMENGQYDDRWQAAHMVPEQVAKAYQELKAEKVFPIHWGMFPLAMHPWNEPPTRLLKAVDNQDDVVIPKIGLVYDLNQMPKSEVWW